jgi:hypothetical protein
MKAAPAAANPCAVTGKPSAANPCAMKTKAPAAANPCAAKAKPAAANPCAVGEADSASEATQVPEDLVSTAVATPLTPREIAAAQRRVQKMEKAATTRERQILLDEKRGVAEAWVESMGPERARIKARKTARAFMASAKATRAEKGAKAADIREAIALAIYWRDVCDLIIAAAARPE